MSFFLEALTFARSLRFANLLGSGVMAVCERRPRPDLDRPKSEFAGSLSAAKALCGRHYGNDPSDEREPCYLPRLACYSCLQPRPYGANVPGFIEVYSVGSMSAPKYRGAPDREPSPPGAPGPWSIPKNSARTSKSRPCPQCTRPRAWAKFYLGAQTLLPHRSGEQNLKLRCMMSIGGSLSKHSPFVLLPHLIPSLTYMLLLHVLASGD